MLVYEAFVIRLVVANVVFLIHLYCISLSYNGGLFHPLLLRAPKKLEYGIFDANWKEKSWIRSRQGGSVDILNRGEAHQTVKH